MIGSKELEAALEKLQSAGADVPRIREDLTKLASRVDELDVAEDVKSVVNRITEIETTIKALGDTKLKAVNIVDPNWTGPFKNTNECAEFGKWAWSTLMDEKYAKDLSEGTDAQGGFLVPEVWVPELIRLVEMQGVARQEFRIVPLTSDKQMYPKRSSGFTKYWVGEAVAITASDLTLAQVTLEPSKMAVLTLLSSELDEDAFIAIGQFIAEEFAYTMATEEDRVGFNGTGIAGDGNITGWLQSSDTQTVTMGSGDTTFSSLDFDDLIDVVDAINSSALAGAKWYMHRTILSIIRKKKDGDSRPLLEPSLQDGAPPSIHGYPVKTVDQMPTSSDSAVSTPYIAFGDPRFMYFGDRRKPRFGQSEHIKFVEDQIALKMTERIEIEVADGNALAALKTAAA